MTGLICSNYDLTYSHKYPFFGNPNGANLRVPPTYDVIRIYGEFNKYVDCGSLICQINFNQWNNTA
jgi:hypothetical protein